MFPARQYFLKPKSGTPDRLATTPTGSVQTRSQSSSRVRMGMVVGVAHIKRETQFYRRLNEFHGSRDDSRSVGKRGLACQTAGNM